MKLNPFDMLALGSAPYAFYLLTNWAYTATRNALRKRKTLRQAASMRRDWDAQQQRSEELNWITGNNRRFEKGLSIRDLIEVRDDAGIVRVRLGTFSEKSDVSVPRASLFGASAPAMPPLQHDKPLARTSRNCVNCGAPVKAPVCAHCGTEHETAH